MCLSTNNKQNHIVIIYIYICIIIFVRSRTAQAGTEMASAQLLGQKFRFRAGPKTRFGLKRLRFTESTSSKVFRQVKKPSVWTT